MAVCQAGFTHHPRIQQFQAQHLCPSISSKERWEELEALRGHIRPCRHTGKSLATAVLCDHNLVHISLYQIAYPKAATTKINAFLYRANYGDPNIRYYSPSQISENEVRIGLTRKRGSTTAYEALLPWNKHKC